MSIDRVGQYPFEMNYVQTNQEDRGLWVEGGDIYTFGEAATKPYTGDRSLYFSSRASEGMGFPFPASDDLRGGWSWLHNGIQVSGAYFFLNKSSAASGSLVRISWNDSENCLGLYVNNVLVQSANIVEYPNFHDFGRWSHHGWHVIGGSRFVYTIDGDTVFDYSDVTIPTGYESAWMFTNTGWGITSVDDFWLEIVAGESYAIPPTYRYLQSVVDADGTIQDWAGYPVAGDDYTKVDDSSVDDDATYLWIGASGSVEMFNTANITLPAHHSIVSAIPWCLARKGNISLASQIRLKADDGTVWDGTDQNLPGFYAELWERMLLDPSGASWTDANFNACEFGFETRGTV